MGGGEWHAQLRRRKGGSAAAGDMSKRKIGTEGERTRPRRSVCRRPWPLRRSGHSIHGRDVLGKVSGGT